MKRFQRILVIMGARAGDRFALEWAGRVAQAAGSEQVRQWYRQPAGVHLAGFLEKSPRAATGFRSVLREAPIPRAGIVEELQNAPYDLVVLTTRGRNAVSRALLGSNTAEVIRRSQVPVLAVKVKGEGLALLCSLLGIGDKEEPRIESAS